MNIKRSLSPIVILIVLVSLVTGISFGSVGGYIVGNAVASSPESFIVEAVSSDMAVDLEAASHKSPATSLSQTPDHPADKAYSTVEAVDMVLPAVVTIIGGGSGGFGSGSGFFVSSEGYVVTNYHVVKEAEKLAVIYAQGGIAEAEIVGSAPEFDLAVIKVDGSVPAVVEWGDSGAFPLGTDVIAIGSALGRYQNTVTAGILSGYNRELGGLRGLLQTDAAVNQGNSGGPLINLAGEVIGINTLIVRGRFAEAEGLSFAIPSNVAKSVVQQLIDTGEVQQPYLGVRYSELYQGALLKQVFDDAPANSAGLQAGDVILAVDGLQVDERHPFVSVLVGHIPGDTVTLDVRRDDETFQTELTLG